MSFPPPSGKTRKQLLTEYLREVARDLMLAGIIRAQSGVGLGDVMRSEPGAMLESVVADLKTAGLTVKDDVIAGVVQGFLNAVFKPR